LILIEVHKPHAIKLFKDPFTIEDGVLIPRILAIGDDSPDAGADDAQGHLSLQAGLIEAGEDPEAVESFELRVEILLTIRLIDELMEARPIFLVGREVFEGNYIPSLLEVSDLKSNLLTYEIFLIQFRVFVDR
jgi:hypothetical protein